MGAIPEYAGGEVIANKYVVDRPLGDGPNSRAYLADSGMGSPKLCVKLFRADLSARLLSAPDFFLKAGVATEIEHDNLVSCLDVQEEMGHVYTARTYVDGPDFEDWMRRNRAEGNYYTRGLELLWQACQGLSALHERTRHLNIHPGNLLITSLQAKLADWDPRSLGSMEMTPDPLPFRPQYAGYRAPEMSGGGSFLSYPSTDLFAVAGLLYRLVVGEHPVDPSRSQAGLRGLEKDLGSFLAKAMHPRPEERYQDAPSFSDALWELHGAMQRLQDSRQAPLSREEKRPLPPTGGQLGSGPNGEAVEKASPTIAMSPGGSATLFGTPRDQGTPRDPKPQTQKNDTFFGLFPDEAATGKPSASEPRRDAPKTQSTGDTFFGTPKTQSSGDTFFGTPKTQSSGDTFFGTPKAQSSGDTFFGSLEEKPGTRSGAAPNQPPQKSSSRGHKAGSRPPVDAKPAPVTLSSLEKDVLEVGQESASSGYTQYGTQFSEGDKQAGQRKLMLALAAVGALVLVLALGGLFVYLHSTAAPEIPPGTADPAGEDDGAATAGIGGTTGQAAQGSGESGLAATADKVPGPQAGDGPPFPVEETTEEPARPGTGAEAVQSSGATVGAVVASGVAAKGTPERLAELMAMVAARSWPSDARSRLQAADELNDFGKVAEANKLYELAAGSPEATEKQKISALGGQAVTFYSMGMKQQSSDAIARILELNPRNAFALKFREKLK